MNEINKLEGTMQEILKKEQHDETRSEEREEFIACIENNKFFEEENDKSRRE